MRTSTKQQRQKRSPWPSYLPESSDEEEYHSRGRLRRNDGRTVNNKEKADESMDEVISDVEDLFNSDNDEATF